MTSQTSQIIVVLLTRDDIDHAHRLRNILPDGACLAVLQACGLPTLTSALDSFAAGSSNQVRVICWSANPRSQRSWVIRVVSHWLRNGGSLPVFVDAVTCHDADELREHLVHDSVEAHAIGPDEAPLKSPAWDNPPDFRHHVLVCRGPRCSAHGADAIAAELTAELARRDLLDKSVLVTQTGCMFPCNRAPLIVVYPDNEWYESLTIEDIAWFVDRLEVDKDERTGPSSWIRLQ